MNFLKRIVKKINYLDLAIFGFFLLLICLLFFQQIDLSVIDLGRHIKNGEIVIKDSGVLFRNFYSYTEPAQAFINHHWLSGLIFYLVYSLGGFKILSLFNIILALISYSLIFLVAKKRSNIIWTTITFIPIAFLIVKRVEIRPEIFSYLFLALTLLIAYCYRRSKNIKTLYFLPLLLLFWVNFHIYFIVGLAVIFFLVLDTLFNYYRDQPQCSFSLKKLITHNQGIILIALASVAVCLLNPNFTQGFLYPFQIFKEYGYDIAENQTPLFMEVIGFDYSIVIWKYLAVLSPLLLMIDFLVRKKLRLFDYLVTLFAIGISLTAIRNLAIFAILIWPVNAYTLACLEKRFSQRFKISNQLVAKILKIGALTGLWFLITIFIQDEKKNHFFIANSWGLDLVDGSEDVFKFFKNNHLSGPVFNNYDNGSAFIFELFPDQRPFVDNRPEAYSVAFFNDQYKPMQENANIWQQQLSKYQFQAIIFSYQDGTPWARTFLRAGLSDPEWSLIYFDYHSLILIRNTESNQELTTKYSLDFWQIRQRIRDLARNDNQYLLINLASFASLIGQPELAREIYQGILYHQGDNKKILTAMAYSYFQSVDEHSQKLAISYFEKAEKLGYVYSRENSDKALAYWNLGDYGRAIKAWQKDRHSTNARDYLEQARKLQLSNPELFKGLKF